MTKTLKNINIITQILKSLLKQRLSFKKIQGAYTTPGNQTSNPRTNINIFIEMYFTLFYIMKIFYLLHVRLLS